LKRRPKKRKKSWPNNPAAPTSAQLYSPAKTRRTARSPSATAPNASLRAKYLRSAPRSSAQKCLPAAWNVASSASPNPAGRSSAVLKPKPATNRKTEPTSVRPLKSSVCLGQKEDGLKEENLKGENLKGEAETVLREVNELLSVTSLQ